MQLANDQVDELKALFPLLQKFEEGSLVYFLIPTMQLPPGCAPAIVDALFCPFNRGDGYPSRLFFSKQFSSPIPRNWNGQDVRIIERNWHAISWKIGESPLRLAQMISAHLRAFQ